MKGLIISFLVALTSVLSAQNILISEGLDVRSDLTYELLGDLGDGYMVASYSGDQVTVHVYDREMYITSHQEFILPDKKAKIIHVYPHEDHFSVLYTLPTRDTLLVINQSYKSNFERLQTDTLVRFERTFQNISFRYTFSEDKSKLGLVAKKGDELIYYLIYDLKWNEIVHRDALDFAGFSFYDDYRKTVLTNSGILYMIFEQNNYLAKRGEHAFFIYKVRDAGVIEESVLPMKTLLTYDALFQYDNVNNKLIISGLASEKNLSQAELIFQVKQDPKEPEFFEYTTFVFHNNLLDDFYGNSRKAKFDYLRDVQIQDVVLMGDGSAIMILEEVSRMERMSYGNRMSYYGSRYTVDYHYENILLFHLNTSGESWQKLLPKRQFSNDDEGAYSSYFLFKNPNHLRLIYNDEIRNENTVSEYIVRPNGASLRTNLLSTDFQKLRLQVRNGLQLSSHKVLIPSVRGKILKLLLIDYLDQQQLSP